MKLNELSDNPKSTHARKRVGRGTGSGLGKTSGKGHKGQKSRSGVAIKGFEGGQMPINRRLPKRGFTNIFRKDYVAVNVGTLQAAIDAGRLDAKNVIDAAALQAAGIVGRSKDGVRVLAKGEIKAKVKLAVAGASKAAIEAVEKAGGSIEIAAVKPEPKAEEAAKQADAE